MSSAASSIVLKAQGAALDPLFSPDEARALGAARETVFLGLVDEAPRFGVGLDAAAIEALKTRDDLKLIDLRTIAVQGEVDAAHVPPLAEAKAVLGWHARHRFCPNCGAATELTQAGWRRDCPVCKAEHFPRTDPVVIMLPVAGDRCVLGRSPRFPQTMWSCLAGFCEPGESIEEAVRREVAEEVGLTCAQVKYFASQPWPFPSSLMIGCHAQAVTEADRHRQERDRRGALVRSRRADADADAATSGPPDHAAADRYRASHHPRFHRARPRRAGIVMAAESANARPVKSNANAPRILCTGIIVLDEVFRVEEFPKQRRQGRGEGVFHRQWRLRGECRRRRRAARRPGAAGGPAGRTRRRRTTTAIACWRRWRARRSTAAPVNGSMDWRRRCRRFSSTRRASAPS